MQWWIRGHKGNNTNKHELTLGKLFLQVCQMETQRRETELGPEEAHRRKKQFCFYSPNWVIERQTTNSSPPPTSTFYFGLMHFYIQILFRLNLCNLRGTYRKTMKIIHPFFYLFPQRAGVDVHLIGPPGTAESITGTQRHTRQIIIHTLTHTRTIWSYQITKHFFSKSLGSRRKPENLRWSRSCLVRQQR